MAHLKEWWDPLTMLQTAQASDYVQIGLPQLLGKSQTKLFICKFKRIIKLLFKEGEGAQVLPED